MAGVYVHIPFCSAKCYYCDFYSRANIPNNLIDEYAEALCKEIEIRQQYLQTKEIDTIYLGGGTPSILTIDILVKIFDKILSVYSLKKDYEITIEINPEDCSKQFFSNLKKHTLVNRISIGAQSFDDNLLKIMNRRNDVQKNIEAINNAIDSSFENISIDLIYGIPEQNIEIWQKDLDIAFSMPIKHISAYCLTIEENTVFGKWKNAVKIKEIDEDIELKMYNMLIDQAQANCFEHYEISNFCKTNYQSKHNSSYWFGDEYLGIGASAHSYNKISRQWNVANIKQYIEKIKKNEVFFENEQLSQRDFFNEYLLTRLRTSKGIEIEYLNLNFASYYAQIQNYINEFLSEKLLEQHGTTILLSKQGKFVSDTIIRKLYII